jgi:hypothetical protein
MYADRERLKAFLRGIPVVAMAEAKPGEEGKHFEYGQGKEGK